MKKKSELQAYDNTLNALFGKEADQIIPYLPPGAEFIGNLCDEERNILASNEQAARMVLELPPQGDLL